jgi:hypothetical protein
MSQDAEQISSNESAPEITIDDSILGLAELAVGRKIMSLPEILEYHQEDLTNLEDKIDIYGENDPINIDRRVLLNIEGKRAADDAKFYPKYLERIREARKTGKVGDLDIEYTYDLAINELQTQKAEQRRKAQEKETARLQRDTNK